MKYTIQLSTAVLILFLFSMYSKSFLYDDLENKIAIPSSLWARDKIDGPVDLTDKISILVWDNKTYNKLGDPDLMSSKTFLELLNIVCHNKPRIVIIDKKFANLKLNKNENKLYQDAFRKCKIATLADFSNPKNYLDVPSVPDELLRKFSVNDHRSEKTISSEKLYAANPFYLDSISAIGNANYKEPGYIKPFKEINGYVIPHIGLTAVKNIQFSNKEVHVDFKKTRLSLNHETFINWVPQKRLLKRSISIHSLMKFSQKKKTLKTKAIAEDDTVLILPLFYTGSADFKGTPYGETPGGFAIASVVNSVMKNNWISISDYQKSLVFILFLLVSLLVVFQKSIRFNVMSYFGINVIFFAATIFIFVQYQIMFKWFHPFVMINLGFISQFAIKFFQNEINNQVYQQALGGVVSPDVLQYIQQNPSKLDLTPCEHEISVVFVDFISFSTLAEQSDPREVFMNLRSGLNLLSKIVHQYDGVVDKSLGDGLLCYFGYDPIRRTNTSDHAQKALEASIEMQRSVAKTWVENKDNPECLPIRIGINTGHAMVGNICDDDKVDLSIIGHTVNLAQRYEGNCESFKIMIGPTTKLKLKDEYYLKHLIKRKISIKHYLGQYNAYEIDPFDMEASQKPEIDLLAAVRNFRESIQLDRKDKRYLVEAEWKTEVTDSYGKVIGELLNFSYSGVCLFLYDFISAESPLIFNIEIKDEVFEVSQTGLLQGRIAWGKKYKNGFIHGVSLVFSDSESESTFAKTMKMIS